GGDLNRAPDVRAIEHADHDLPQALDRDDRHLPRLERAVPDGLRERVRLVADGAGDDADADAPDLGLLSARDLLLAHDARHREVNRPAVAFPRDLEGLGRPLLNRLHQLFGREDRLAGDGVDEIAGLEPGLLGGRSGGDRADLRRELGPRAELPRLPRLP